MNSFTSMEQSLFENLTVAQIVKELLVCCGTRRFITMFTIARIYLQFYYTLAASYWKD